MEETKQTESAVHLTDYSPDQLPEKWKAKHNRKKSAIVIAITILLLVLVGLVTLFLYKIKNNLAKNTRPSREGTGNIENRQPGDVQITENTITASGTVSVGITNEEFDLDYLDTELEIEEVYLTSNTEVTEGEKIAKLTEKSLAQALDELNDARTEADLAYRAGLITFEQAKIEAKYEYDSNLLNGSQAQQVYDETLQQLQKAIDDAQKDIDEAKEEIAEYTDALENDAYDEKYQVSYFYQKYQDDLELLMDKMEEWGLPWPYVTGQDDDGNAVKAPGNLPNLSTAQKLYQEVDEEAKEYDQAKEEYDAALANAKYGLEERNLEMASLESALLTAQNAYDEGAITAKAAYDTAITKQKNAQSIYDTAIKKAQEELDSLKDEKNDAEENLAEFQERAGGGYLYTTGAGNVLMVMLEEGSILTGNSMLLAYSNTNELTVMVSVSQNVINEIYVGEDVSVTVSDYGTFSGKVQNINPVSQSSSRSSVTYLVTVSLEGDVSMLSANLSAQVTFGTDKSNG